MQSRRHVVCFCCADSQAEEQKDNDWQSEYAHYFTRGLAFWLQVMIVEYSLLAQCKPLYFAVIRAIFSADANANQISEFESFRTARTALLSHSALDFIPAHFG